MQEWYIAALCSYQWYPVPPLTGDGGDLPTDLICTLWHPIKEQPQVLPRTAGGGGGGAFSCKSPGRSLPTLVRGINCLGIKFCTFWHPRYSSGFVSGLQGHDFLQIPGHSLQPGYCLDSGGWGYNWLLHYMSYFTGTVFMSQM